MLQTFRTLSSLKRTTLLGAAVAAVAGIGALAAPAHAEFEQGDFELRISGFAQNDSEFSGAVANIGGALGYFFSDQFEAGVRQDYSYTDIGNVSPGSDHRGATSIFADYHFGDPEGAFQPFIGASIGGIYGDGVNDTFVAGPEVGIKYFVDPNWFIFGQVEYQFFFENSDEAGDNFNDGVFNYRLGIGGRIGNAS